MTDMDADSIARLLNQAVRMPTCTDELLQQAKVSLVEAHSLSKLMPTSRRVPTLSECCAVALATHLRGASSAASNRMISMTSSTLSSSSIVGGSTRTEAGGCLDNYEDYLMVKLAPEKETF